MEEEEYQRATSVAFFQELMDRSDFFDWDTTMVIILDRSFLPAQLLPCHYPLDLFEHLWVVDIVDRFGIDRYFKKEIKESLDYAYRHRDAKRGMGWVRCNPILDVDDTAMGLKILRLHGYNVEYALKYPWHRSMPRLEERSYIEHFGSNDVWMGKTVYKMLYVSNKKYLELAKLDFNMVQALHKKETQHIVK
eukprot:Gb_31182 [translate_table: standard]